MITLEYYAGTEFELEAVKAQKQYEELNNGGWYSTPFKRDEGKRIRKMTGGTFMSMGFNKKADYADFVTVELCKYGQEMIRKVIIVMIADWSEFDRPPKSQYIANFCYVTKRVDDDDMRDKCVALYKKVFARK